MAECWEHLKNVRSSIGSQGRDVDALHIHTVEVYLSLVIAAFRSGLLAGEADDKYRNPPWMAHSGLPPWLGFFEWYAWLKATGLHWEAQRIQQLLFSVVGFKDALGILIRRDQFKVVTDSISGQNFDEALVVSELIASNNICGYLLDTEDDRLISILARAYLKASHSLAEMLLARSNFDEIGETRPVQYVKQLDDCFEQMPQVTLALRKGDSAALHRFFFHAAKEGTEKIVEKLLAVKEVNRNHRDDGGQTALSHAAGRGHVKVVRLLLEDGSADVNSRDNNGWTPLFHAAAHNRTEVVNLLLAHPNVDPNIKDLKQRTPLSYVTENRCFEVFKLLLADPDVDPDSKDFEQRTPLSYAVEEKYYDMVGILLDTHEVDPNSKDLKGRTPLSYAAEVGSLGALQQLLYISDEVQVDSRDTNGWTPLFYAVAGDRPDPELFNREIMVEELLDFRAELDCRDRLGRTPLSYAAEKGRRSLVELLLKLGAQADVKDNEGRTPASYAQAAGYQDIYDVLSREGTLRD
ncbi:20494ec3-15fd-4a47-8ca0-e1eb2e362af1 [Thermothielavioides terrestris]|uniref:20494ec3-15fd-4a47-8ca0-e1eb2e362af1 n=2 Tax=Thermothielavioides terrestris TaxID=2587410 RepID=A0A3S4AL22_9PEZI|nr:20494ec3-15fd-4a47-8ca0-e1eb2e362af1 [Thermothielavioides terrestris]